MTSGGSIQNFTIPNRENVDDDPIFSVSGDLAMNCRSSDNGIRIALTGGHFSANESTQHNTDGLGIDLGLVEENQTEKPTYKIEISNIQSCSSFACKNTEQKIQGKDHGTHYKNGVVYGNYAIYVSNGTTKFPSNQHLSIIMKGETFSFTIACRFF